MDRLKLLLADSNEDFRLALKNTLQDSYQVHLCSDGKDALQAAKEIQPDILILDLLLTGLDGVSLLQELQAAQLHPTTMVVTRLNNAYVETLIDELKIDYIMLKPCDPSTVAKRVADLHARLHENNDSPACITNSIVKLLNQLSFLPKLLGYQYLIDGISLMYYKPHIAITKELYPKIAAKNHASVMMVERSIRTAIHSAWLEGNPKVWAEYFPPDPAGIVPRPSNGSFISRIASILHTSGKTGE